jgi:RNA polymerase sigma-32 factor
MSNALALKFSRHLAVLGQDVDEYTQAVKAIPTLTLEEEQELTKRFYKTGDLKSARELVASHLRFVLYIAQGYRGYGLDEADLIQEGNIGLMKAIKRFDPSLGVRLVSFAVHWIRAEIHDYILRNWRIVKIVTTKAHRKLFFNLRGLKKHFGWLSSSEVDKIANDLGVSSRDVFEMEKRLCIQDIAFEVPDGENDDDTFAPAAYLEDNRYDPAITVEEDNWDTQNHRQLQRALRKLDARSRDIVRKRWLTEDKSTLQQLATHYKISAERIRQIEVNALKKLKNTIKRPVV